MRTRTTLLVLVTMLAAQSCGTSKRSAAKDRGAHASSRYATLEAFGAQLVRAIHQGDFSLARPLLPSVEELRAVTGGTRLSDAKYQAFIAKAKRGFKKVVAKVRRRHKPGCKVLTFARVKRGQPGRVGKAKGLSGIDVFARCDGKEIWVADPDGLFKSSGGWRAMELD